MSVYLLIIIVYKQWIKIKYTKYTYYRTNSIILTIIIKIQTLLLNIVIRYTNV